MLVLHALLTRLEGSLLSFKSLIISLYVPHFVLKLEEHLLLVVETLLVRNQLLLQIRHCLCLLVPLSSLDLKLGLESLSPFYVLEVLLLQGGDTLFLPVNFPVYLHQSLLDRLVLLLLHDHVALLTSYGVLKSSHLLLQQFDLLNSLSCFFLL